MQVFRTCPRQLFASSSRVPWQAIRLFSSTPQVRASEPPKIDFKTVEAFKQSHVFQNIASNPQAVEAITKFGVLMQAKGVDFTGKQPSMFQLSKLLLDSEFRNASKELVEALQKAGIDVNKKDIMEEFSRLGRMIPK